jgi:hypothetical protein
MMLSPILHTLSSPRLYAPLVAAAGVHYVISGLRPSPEKKPLPPTDNPLKLLWRRDKDLLHQLIGTILLGLATMILCHSFILGFDAWFAFALLCGIIFRLDNLSEKLDNIHVNVHICNQPSELTIPGFTPSKKSRYDS